MDLFSINRKIVVLLKSQLRKMDILGRLLAKGSNWNITDNHADILNLHKIVLFCCYTSILKRTRIICCFNFCWFDILLIQISITKIPMNTFFLKTWKPLEKLKFYNTHFRTSLGVYCSRARFRITEVFGTHGLNQS